MLQTRVEAAGVVLSLQRSALGRGVAWFAIAGIAAIALMFALLLLVAFGTPENYRVAALSVVSLALLAVAVFCALHAKSQMTRDSALIADFTTGLRLDLAMLNLALKNPETEDAGKIAERERAKDKVREAAVARAEAPSTAEGADAAAADGPRMASTTAAMHAAAPRVTDPDVRGGAVSQPVTVAPTATGGPDTIHTGTAPPSSTGADSQQRADDARRQHGTT